VEIFCKTVGKICLPESIKDEEMGSILIRALGKNAPRTFNRYPGIIQINVRFPKGDKEQVPQLSLMYRGRESRFYSSLHNEKIEQFKLLIELANDEKYEIMFIEGFTLNDIFAISFLERINDERHLSRDHLILIFKGLYNYVKYPNKNIPSNKTIMSSLLMKHSVYEAEEALLKENGCPDVSELKSIYNQHIDFKDNELKYYEWLSVFNTDDKTINQVIHKPKLELLLEIDPLLKTQGDLFKEFLRKKQDLNLELEF
jgi:hypothetical protein